MTRAYVKKADTEARLTCTCGHPGKIHHRSRAGLTFCLVLVNHDVAPTTESRWCPCNQFSDTSGG